MKQFKTMSRTKQNVFVPQYEGRSVHETYYGIPAKNYLQAAKDVLNRFIVSNNCRMTIETARQGGLKHINNVSVEVEKANADCDRDHLVMKAGGQRFTVAPTKFGFDKVGILGTQNRIWLFDEHSLNDFNLTCETFIGMRK